MWNIPAFVDHFLTECFVFHIYVSLPCDKHQKLRFDRELVTVVIQPPEHRGNMEMMDHHFGMDIVFQNRQGVPTMAI